MGFFEVATIVTYVIWVVITHIVAFIFGVLTAPKVGAVYNKVKCWVLKL
jgi:hypothetical protein